MFMFIHCHHGKEQKETEYHEDGDWHSQNLQWPNKLTKNVEAVYCSNTLLLHHLGLIQYTCYYVTFHVTNYVPATELLQIDINQ